jgi:hypothetical protein
MCPHCGYRGLEARFKGRRLLAEHCPDCSHLWTYILDSRPGRWRGARFAYLN